MSELRFRIEPSIVCTHPDDSWEASPAPRFPATPNGLELFREHVKCMHSYELTQADIDRITNAPGGG